MDAGDLLVLCLGLQPRWRLVGQWVNTSSPHEAFLEVTANRGAKYLYPVCGVLCKPHDFQELTCRNLNLFQHHCYATARLPRVDCLDHRIKEGQGECGPGRQPLNPPVRAGRNDLGARYAFAGYDPHHLWRVVYDYVTEALARLDLSSIPWTKPPANAGIICHSVHRL